MRVQLMRTAGVILVMGVSGCGKSTLGAALARRLGWTFIEADGFHPAANIEKMRAGVPLDDEDRGPWLEALAKELRGRRGAVVLACSALKGAYRARLLEGLEVGALVVHVVAPREALRAALEARAGAHFMPASLLESQLAALEAPSDQEPGVVGVLTLAAFGVLGEMVERVLSWEAGFRTDLR